MISKIYCRTTEKGVQSYYITCGKETHFLCNASYHKSNRDFFVSGRRIDEVLDARRHVSNSVRKISERIVKAVKYLESEYDLCVFNQTAKKKTKSYSAKRQNLL